MQDVIFLTWDELIEGHSDQLKRYGGQEGFIDENAVRSAMARAEFKAKYDGNKRAAVIACTTFLRKNGWKPFLTDELMYLVSIGIATANVDEEMLAQILRDHIEPVDANDSDA
jgi:prophage maintenance system killer protein